MKKELQERPTRRLVDDLKKKVQILQVFRENTHVMKFFMIFSVVPVLHPPVGSALIACPFNVIANLNCT